MMVSFPSINESRMSSLFNLVDMCAWHIIYKPQTCVHIKIYGNFQSVEALHWYTSSLTKQCCTLITFVLVIKNNPKQEKEKKCYFKILHLRKFLLQSSDASQCLYWYPYLYLCLLVLQIYVHMLEFKPDVRP